MQTITIAAVIITTVSVLGYILFQVFKTDRSDSSYNMHPSNFEKPDLEHTINFEQGNDKIKDTPDLNDLLNDLDDPASS